MWSNVVPYREKFLEFVCSTGENVDKYQTMLAELYIENLFKIQDKSYKERILHPTLINPRRKVLIKFLEEKNKYNATALNDKISDSWLTEEKIILLVKMKRYDEAIKIFVDNGQF